MADLADRLSPVGPAWLPHVADDSLLTRRELCAWLRVHPTTLNKWVRDGDFPQPVKFGWSRHSRVRWRAGTVKAWLQQHDGNEV